MNLSRMLRARAEEGRPVKVGLIGAGKFGSMFLAQVRTTTGMHLLGVADLSVDRARAALEATGWTTADAVAQDFDQAAKTGRTVLTEDAAALIASDIDVIVDATGSPAAAIRHAKLAFANGKHVVMVTVEADALAGPWLAEEARKAGVVYSMAYGDQPALVCEMIDWAHSCGFRVTAAGKGTRYMPAYHGSTPATVWTHFGITDDEAKQAGMNPQMFNSFVDGTKSGIEMAAISNATGLRAPSNGLLFPPAGTHDLARVLCPKADGGVLEENGMVEVVTDYERDGRAVYNDLRWGVYIVFEAADPGESGRYTRRCFREYGMATDPSGRYTALYRPFHLIGLELGVSVASAALRGEPTGAPEAFNSDVVSVTKKDLAPGDVLDGEGGYTVWGRVMPAAASLAAGGLPIGLAHGVKVTRPVAKGSVVTWDDVEMPQGEAVDARRALEADARGSIRAVA